MNYADMLEQWFEDGMGDLWRNIHAMPEEKLDWKPGEKARTARELVEEIVHVMPFNTILVKTLKAPEGEWEGAEKGKSMTELEKQLHTLVKEFIAAVREFPDDKLDTEIDLGWMKMTFSQVIAYPYWNMMYHIGQIGYIQTLYGDTETH